MGNFTQDDMFFFGSFIAIKILEGDRRSIDELLKEWIYNNKK